MALTLRRLLEESMSALEQDQLPPHRTAELSAINSEIEARKNAIQNILKLHKIAGQKYIRKCHNVAEDSIAGDIEDTAESQANEEDLDESFFENDATIGKSSNAKTSWLTELPKVALLVHISEIQQLHRGLCIYRYERHKMLVRCALECGRRGQRTVGPTLASRLSPEEVSVLNVMLADPHLHSLSYGTTCHPTQEDTVKDMRGLYVAEEIGSPNSSAGTADCAKFFEMLHGGGEPDILKFLNIQGGG
eukprot:Lankesteria_metandrocarpae@DN1352_c0_g1_i1.p1